MTTKKPKYCGLNERDILSRKVRGKLSTRQLAKIEKVSHQTIHHLTKGRVSKHSLANCIVDNYLGKSSPLTAKQKAEVEAWVDREIYALTDDTDTKYYSSAQERYLTLTQARGHTIEHIADSMHLRDSNYPN